MTIRSMAKRYALALFDVTHKLGREDQAGEDLSTLASIIAGHADLRKVLESPAVPSQKKKEVLDAIVAQSGFSGEVTRMLDLLAERDRLMYLTVVAEVYAERLLQAKKIVPAEVTTAVPLEDRNRAALSQALGRAAGGQVTLTERVDPSIIGGVVAKVGSIVFDGSVTRQLEKLGEKLRAEG